jgi:hypothetical protein
MVRKLICLFRGHTRWDDPPYYWHSVERCSFCKQLTNSPMVSPDIWR